IRVLRMGLATIWEYLREERDRLISHIRGRYTHYWWYLPFLHIGSNVILRELQTLAVLLDIYTGVPAIYTTYNVYDEFAHHFGPSSRSEEHTSELQSREKLVCRLLLEKNK